MRVCGSFAVRRQSVGRVCTHMWSSWSKACTCTYIYPTIQHAHIYDLCSGVEGVVKHSEGETCEPLREQCLVEVRSRHEQYRLHEARECQDDEGYALRYACVCIYVYDSLPCVYVCLWMHVGIHVCMLA